MKRLLLLLALLWSAPALAGIVVDNAWVRPTPPGAKLAAGYMTIRNNSGTPDRLVGASTSAAEEVETHVTLKDGDVMRMRKVEGYEIPGNGSFQLRPGGPHLMFVNIKARYREGEKLPVTLKFERVGEMKVEFRVGRPAGDPGLPGPKQEHKP